MKIIITGGHLSPLLAVLETLPNDCQVLIVGRKHPFEGDTSLSLEYQTANKLRIPFKSIIAGRLQRTFTRYTLGSLFKFPIGFFQSLQIVRKYAPNVVISFGGYISLPVVLSAKLFNIPIVIHEQTLGGGLANRIAAFIADKICISWESSRKYFPTPKTILTGNPMRKFKLTSIAFKIPKDRIPLLYITGGSTGSHTINVAIEKCLNTLLKHYRIIHQTGGSWDFKDFARLSLLRGKISDTRLQKRYIITKFVKSSDVGSIISACDLVISRAGINTITELLYFRKPTLFIPLNDEQMENANFLKKIELAEILPQDLLSGKKLLSLIQSMMKKKSLYKSQATKAAYLIKKDAARKIVEMIYELAREKDEKKTGSQI